MTASCAFLAQPIDTARAQSQVFISEVNLYTTWKDDPSIKRSLVESFKELLRSYGYRTDECEENTAAWQRVAARLKDKTDTATYKEIDRRIVAAQRCSVPPSAATAYDVNLVLDYDPLLRSRRAVLHLIPLDGGDSIDGGYAHKPGRLETWYDVMSRAIERTIQGHNEDTSVRVSVPDEADVAQVVRADASASWDADGDAFELRWRILVNACVGKSGSKPLNGWGCPEGMARGLALVHSQFGPSDTTREFRVPMIGDYEIEVQAKRGAHLDPPKRWHLRAYPRRSWTFFTRQAFLRLPKYYLSNTPKNDWAHYVSFGIARRFIQRVGLFGLHEELHYGLALGSLQGVSTYNFSGSATGSTLTLEVLGRTLDRTGRFGMATPVSLGVNYVSARRGGRDHDEWGVIISAMIGAYYAFGENYINKSSPLCSSVCPGLSFGPTLTVLRNFTVEKFGLILGVEADVGLEF